MKKIITEELKLRQKIVSYAIKEKNCAKAARKYHTSRQQVSRWVKRYNGTIDSLRPKSRAPHHHPNSHTKDDITLICQIYRRYKRDGLAEVYVQCCKRGYTRHYCSMLKQIKRHYKADNKGSKKKYPRSKWQPEETHAPGDKVQIDIKYVPQSCIGWDSHGIKYYQITAIDEWSRKRVTKIVDEKSVTHTALFLLDLEEKMGFKIRCIQTDNGREFTNDEAQKEEQSVFEKVIANKGWEYKRTRPYSPWQNGKVERSHREDSEKFYDGKVFSSLEELEKKHYRYVSRQNHCAKKVLGFKSPQERIDLYFSNQTAVV